MKLGGLYLNFERVQSAGELFCPDQHILPSSTTVFRIGKCKSPDIFHLYNTSSCLLYDTKVSSHSVCT